MHTCGCSSPFVVQEQNGLICQVCKQWYFGVLPAHNMTLEQCIAREARIKKEFWREVENKTVNNKVRLLNDDTTPIYQKPDPKKLVVFDNMIKEIEREAAEKNRLRRQQEHHDKKARAREQRKKMKRHQNRR